MNRLALVAAFSVAWVLSAEQGMSEQGMSEQGMSEQGMSEQGRLIGRVVDIDGSHVAGAEVSLFVTDDRLNEATPALATNTRTDAQGVFQVIVPQTAVHASIWVDVPERGFGVRPVAARQPPATADGLPDETLPADSPDRFVVRLVRGTSRLRVVDAQKQPLPGAKVLVRQVVAWRMPYDKPALARQLARDRGLPEQAMLKMLLANRGFVEPVPAEFQRRLTGATDEQGLAELPAIALKDIALLEIETEALGRQLVSWDDDLGLGIERPERDDSKPPADDTPVIRLRDIGNDHARPVRVFPRTSQSPSLSPEDLQVAREARIAAHDRAAAQLLTGIWKMTLPRGFTYSITLTQRPDGLLELRAKEALVSRGGYAFSKNRLALVEPADSGVDDFMYELSERGNLRLVHEQHRVGADYLGTTLHRVDR